MRGVTTEPKERGATVARRLNMMNRLNETILDSHCTSDDLSKSSI